MQLSTEELTGGITKIVLDGRFDIAGAETVDLKLNVIAASKKLIVIDMQKVAFLGSMGLRTIVSAVRTIRSRGGKIALYGPDAEVARVLTTSGISAMVPIHQDIESAIVSVG